MDDNALFCSKCGARANGEGPRVNYNPYGGFGGYNAPVYDTKESLPIAILSFVFWQIGLAVWLFCRHTRPGKARSAAKGALSSACVGMPILGAALWLIWKDDMGRRDYAKLCGISAIVGAALYAVMIIGVIVLNLTGIVDEGYFTTLPIGEMMASIVNTLKFR